MLFIRVESKSQKFLIIAIAIGGLLLGIAAGIGWLMGDKPTENVEKISDIASDETSETSVVGYYELGVDDTYNYIENYEALNSVRFPAVGIAQVGAATNEYYKDLGYENTPIKISQQDDDGLHIYFTLTSDDSDKTVAYADYRLLDNTIVIMPERTQNNTGSAEDNIEIENDEEGF